MINGMKRPIGLFTDFGVGGPYVGQVKSVLFQRAREVPVIDLMADAPAFDPRAAGYLLAALVPEWPAGMVVMAVVDPGVGSTRRPLIADIDGRWFVGPDNGLFEPLMRRAGVVRTWAVTWRPARLSASFHGRDLFAPVAARLALGDAPDTIGAEPVEALRFPGWPDDVPEIIYGDAYGNAMTGLRAATVADGALVQLDGRRLARATTFADLPKGSAFWYENSIGLVEIAVSQGRAWDEFRLSVGAQIAVVPA